MTINLMTRFLDGHQIEYTDTAAPKQPRARLDAEAPRPMLAQTVMLNIDGSPAMALIPAGDSLRTDLLKEIIECERIRPAEADELSELFPDCELDAIPPLGILHGMRVFASDELAHSRCLAFYVGSRSRVVEIFWRDYFRLVVPIIAPISVASGTHTRGRPARAKAPELCLS